MVCSVTVLVVISWEINAEIRKKFLALYKGGLTPISKPFVFLVLCSMLVFRKLLKVIT